MLVGKNHEKLRLPLRGLAEVKPDVVDMEKVLADQDEHKQLIEERKNLKIFHSIFVFVS